MTTPVNGVGSTNGIHDAPDDAGHYKDVSGRLIIGRGEQSDPETGLQNSTNPERQVRPARGFDDTKGGGKYEDPFGEERDGGIKYRSLEWWQAGMIMIAETISIGILSLPSVIGRIGLVPGVILLVGLGIVATYTGYVLGQFKLAYPHVHTFADVGEVVFTPIGLGRFGKEFFGAAQLIFLVFVMGSHILTWTIMLNVVTGHGTCTIVFSIVGLVLFWVLDLPRTLKSVSWFSIASFVSIFSAVMITMIDVGVDPPFRGPVLVTATAEFATAFTAASNIIFAYGGHVAFFSFISELREPRDFPKALYMLQITVMSVYITAAVVIEYYAGPNVASPALGSTSSLVSKIAWGVAIPTILIAGVIYGHVASKYIYVRLFRGTEHLSARTWYSYGVWGGITLVLWALAWVIAESIPVFNDLVALISALFVSWFTYGASGALWIFLNWGNLFSSWRKTCLSIVNALIFVVAGAVCGIGLYASGKSIHDDAGSGGSWTCADNSS